MKKMACCLLVILLFTMSVPAFADSVMSKQMETAIITAKDKLGIDDETHVIQSYSESDSTRNGIRLFHLSWEPRNEYETGNIRTAIDENGIIWEYSAYESSKGKVLPGDSEETMRKIAEEFLERVNPVVFAETKFDDMTYSRYSGEYNLSYYRIHGGIRVQNSASVQIHEKTKKVTSFYCDWSHNASFPEGEMITLEDAKERYKEDQGYRLFYYDNSAIAEEGEKEVYLIYAPKGENQYINAFTGESETYQDYYEDGVTADKNEAVSGDASDRLGATLSPEELAYTAEAENLITAEEAEKAARDIPEFGISKENKVASISLNRDKKGRYAYTIQFSVEEEKYGFISVRIDATNGKPQYFSRWKNAEPKELTEKEKETQQAAQLKAADSFIQNYFPEYREQTEIIKQQENYFYFARTENDIPFQNNGMYFTYTDGALSNFGCTWNALTIPAAENAKTLEEAYGVVLAEENFGLRYIPVYPKTGGCEMKAVYSLENAAKYSADSLVQLDYRMREVKEVSVQYTDIAGHYAEQAILKLAEAELVLGDSRETEFKPEETVTQETFLTFLFEATDWGGADVYRTAVSRGLLTEEEISPEKPMTRIEGIRYILRQTEQAELADKPQIFAQIYTDVSEPDRGYAAIAAGIGIVNSTVSQLYPENGLRRADAVMMIYNMLQK